MAVVVGATVLRDATGDVADLLTNFTNSNETTYSEMDVKFGVQFNCTGVGSCKYGSHNSFQVEKKSKNL